MRAGGIRHPQRLLVQFVVLGNVRAAVVALVDVLAVEELHEVIGVGVVGDPRRRTHLQLAFLLELEELGKAVLLHLHPDADGVERLLPHLVLLAAERVGARRIADHQRLAVGQGAKAVGALLVAEAVEQRVGAGGIVLDARLVGGSWPTTPGGIGYCASTAWPLRTTLISSLTLYAIAIARRSAIFSLVRPPTTGSCRFQ